MRKLAITVLAICLLPALTGCLALLAGAGGTALWQAGKVVSEELVSMDKAASAVEAAFKDKNITLTDRVIKTEVTQLRGKDANGTKVAVDVFDKGLKNSKIEIRYGINEETPARDLLNQIKARL